MSGGAITRKISGVESRGIWEDGGSDDGNFLSEFATAFFFAPRERLLEPAILYQQTRVIGQNQGPKYKLKTHTDHRT